MNRTPDEDQEITVKEEMESLLDPKLKKSPFEPVEEESVTAPLPKKFKSPTIADRFDHFIRTVDFDRLVKIILVFIVGMIILGLFAWAIKGCSSEKTGPSSSSRQRRSPLQTQNVNKSVPLKLSDLRYYNSFNRLEKFPIVKPGGHLKIEFDVLEWNSLLNDKADFLVSLKVYSYAGQLMVFEPKLATFKGEVLSNSEKLLVRLQIKTTQDLSPGFYRFLVEVREMTSGRVSQLQTQLRVMP